MKKKSNNKKKYPCIESTLDFPTNDYKIRLWVNEDKLKDIDQSIIKKLKNVKGDKPKIINWCAKNISNIKKISLFFLLSSLNKTT